MTQGAIQTSGASTNQALDHALVLLTTSGEALVGLPVSLHDLRPASKALQAAVPALLDAYDLRRDPLSATRDAVTAIDEARSTLAQISDSVEGVSDIVKWIDDCRGWLLVAEDGFSKLRPMLFAPRPLQVADRVPRLFAVLRPSLGPEFRVAAPALPPPPPPEPIPEDLPPKERLRLTRERASALRDATSARVSERARLREERRVKSAAADADPAPGFLKGSFAAQTTEDFIKRRTRELFEEVAACGVQRIGMLGDEWRSADAIDQRMLRAVDAIAGFGPWGVSEIERLVADAPAKDPSRGFALSFCAGCFEGYDGLAAVERVFRLLEPDAEPVQAAFAGALKLVPHPGLLPLMQRWLTNHEAGVRVVALEVLGHRRVIAEADLSRALTDADPRVVIAALQAGMVGPATHTAQLRGAVLEHASSKGADVRSAVHWALAVGALSGADEQLLAAALAGDETALLPLALVADEDQAHALLKHVVANPSAKGVEALGYAGPSRAVTELIALLRNSATPRELHQTIAFALQRITGFEPMVEVDVPPEDLDVEEPPDPKQIPKEDQQLKRRIGDPRDQPSDGAPDRMRMPTPAARVWEEYLRREATRYGSRQRMRRGRPYTPELSLQELSLYAITPWERRTLYYEFVIKTGEAPSFDPHDFVASQEQALSGMAPIAQRASSRPGSYGRASRR